MASVGELIYTSKDGDGQEIDSRKSWREVGEAQLQASFTSLAKKNLKTKNSLVPFNQWHSCEFTDHNHSMLTLNIFSSRGKQLIMELMDSKEIRKSQHNAPVKPFLVTGEKSSEYFHLFPLLPVELWRKIWFHALPALRIFQLVDNAVWSNPNVLCFGVESLSMENPSKRVRFQETIATLLRVCREAQNIVLQSYSKLQLREAPIANLWDEDVDPELTEVGCTTDVVFYTENFDSRQDILIIDIKVQNIAIYHEPASKNPQYITRLLDEWPHLKSLQIIMGDRSVNSYYDPISEVYCLVNREDLDDLDQNFTQSYGPISQQFSPSSFSPGVSKSRLHFLQTRCRKFDAQLQSVHFALPHCNVDFRISVMGKINGLGYTNPTPKLINLTPTNPKYWGLYFCMIVPGSEAAPLPKDYHMKIEELGCDVACREDGIPLPLYDSDAMKRLFGEDE